MTLIRWEPAHEISLQSEMNRLFNTFFDTPTGGNGAAPRRWVPAMDLVETEAEFVLRADLPGLSQDDVAIELEDNVLTIAGERKAEHDDQNEGYYRVERSYGSFARSVTLPDGVDAGAVHASFADGVLEIRIPKPEPRKPHRVQISTAGGSAPAIEGKETDADGDAG